MVKSLYFDLVKPLIHISYGGEFQKSSFEVTQLKFWNIIVERNISFNEV